MEALAERLRTVEPMAPSPAAKIRGWNLVSAARQTVLSDAQTSGGLLIAIAAGDERRLLDALTARGVAGHVVGELTSGPPGEITVV